MKTEITALELSYLTRELQTLVGSRVDKIYQPTGIYIQLHKTGLGKILLRIEKGALWLSQTKAEMPETPAGLCQNLRKHLEGKKLVSLEQIGGERIIKLTFSTQTDTFYLYVELFSNGNIVLADKDGVIKAAQEERAWKDRAIKRGLTYSFPPPRTNILALTHENLHLHTPEPIEKHLAKLGFGKTYATELCTRANINPCAEKITDKENKTLLTAYEKMLDDKSGAHVYADGEITPFALASYAEKGKKYDTFSLAIDSNLAHSYALAKKEKNKDKYLAEKERIQKSIDLQKKALKKAQEDAVELQHCGELIYQHYQELKDILAELNKAKAKYSLQEIKAKLKGHPKIKDVNPKTGEIVVEIND